MESFQGPFHCVEKWLREVPHSSRNIYLRSVRAERYAEKHSSDRRDRIGILLASPSPLDHGSSRTIKRAIVEACASFPTARKSLSAAASSLVCSSRGISDSSRKSVPTSGHFEAANELRYRL